MAQSYLDDSVCHSDVSRPNTSSNTYHFTYQHWTISFWRKWGRDYAVLCRKWKITVFLMDIWSHDKIWDAYIYFTPIWGKYWSILKCPPRVWLENETTLWCSLLLKYSQLLNRLFLISIQTIFFNWLDMKCFIALTVLYLPRPPVCQGCVSCEASPYYKY